MVKIFVGGLSPVVMAEELKKLFEQYGQVNECDILKNFAFVHMEKEDEAHQAISALHKSEFFGAHLTVEYATSKIRNATKIYVGNVSAKATTAQIRQLFERFGKVVECDIVKNYAFVHMAKEREAMDAILNLNDTPLEDQKIFVTLSKSNGSLRTAKVATVATPPPAATSYYFPRGRVPAPATAYTPYCARAWYDREYCDRYSYELYDRARAAYDRALPPPPPPPPPPPAAYRERSPVGRRTATSTAVVAQYADPYTAAAAAAAAAAATAAANQTYSQAYSQPGYAAAAAAAATYSQYSIGTAYNVAEYYERYASAYAAQYAQTF